MTALSESSERAPKCLRDTPGAAPALQSVTATHPETPLAGAAGLGGHGAWGELFWGGWGGHSGSQGGCWHLPHWYGSRNELGLNLGRVNRVLTPTAQLLGC